MINTLNTLWIFFVFSYYLDLVFFFLKYRYFRPHPLFSLKKGGLFYRYPYVIGAYVFLFALGYLLQMPMHNNDFIYGFIVYALLSFMQFAMMMAILLTLLMIASLYVYTKIKKQQSFTALALKALNRFFIPFVVSSALVSLVLNVFLVYGYLNP